MGILKPLLKLIILPDLTSDFEFRSDIFDCLFLFDSSLFDFTFGFSFFFTDSLLISFLFCNFELKDVLIGGGGNGGELDGDEHVDEESIKSTKSICFFVLDMSIVKLYFFDFSGFPLFF